MHKLSLFFILFFSSLLGEIADPFRWLEDSNDPRTIEWLSIQQEKFNQYAKANPYTERYKESLTKLLDYESYSLPVQCNQLLFYKLRQPSDEQPILYVQVGTEVRVLLDPNQLPGPIYLSLYVPSPDGKWVACGLSESGSDWITWKIIEVSSGKEIPDQIDNCKFLPVVWCKEEEGFYFTRIDPDDVFRIYFHKLNEPDVLVFDNAEHPDFLAESIVSSDGNYLLVNIEKGSSSNNQILFRPSNETDFKILLPFNECKYKYLCNEGNKFYFWTDHNAPFGKVIEVDSENKTQKDFIPESDRFLDHLAALDHSFAVVYTQNAMSQLVILDQKGMKLKELELPSLGTVSLSHSYSRENGFFFSFSNFVQPPMIFHYDIVTNHLEVFKQPQLTFNPSDYEVKQIFYPSEDGTQVPLFIVAKKGIELNSNNETLLYAYGGFGINMYPSFNPLFMAWLENGGVFALANIRGGSELGNEWHEEGKREKRQNSFNDFIAAGKWLIHNGYTNTSKLAIRGGSNGGLLVAVCLNQRPDLFGAALVEVGVLDMLRYHLFTIGRFWMPEFGDPDNQEDQKFLLQYSPYHNVRKGIVYPPILVTTADHDDRVVPLHSYKYTAAMQAAGHENVLLRVSTKSGHGAGKSISQWIEDSASSLSFLKYSLEQ